MRVKSRAWWITEVWRCLRFTLIFQVKFTLEARREYLGVNEDESVV